MQEMFYGCSSLTSINISSFITPNLKEINGMFQLCSSLTYINLSNFNTLKIEDNNKLFYNCSNLKDIDISSFGETINFEKLFNDKLTSEGRIKINETFYYDIKKVIPEKWTIEF